MGFLTDDIVELFAGEELVGGLSILDVCIGGFADRTLGQCDVHHIEPVAIAACRSDADDVLDTIEFEKLP